MSVDRLSGARIDPHDLEQVPGIDHLEVGFTPERLTRRVISALDKFNLTGIEGQAFECLFSLTVYEKRDGFKLQSPPAPRYWESEEHFIPDILARAGMKDPASPDGQMLWAERFTIWGEDDEITSAQKISMVLDVLLDPLETAHIPAGNGKHKTLIPGEEQSPE